MRAKFKLRFDHLRIKFKLDKSQMRKKSCKCKRDKKRKKRDEPLRNENSTIETFYFNDIKRPVYRIEF